MGSLKLTTASSGSVILNPANTASDVTITVPASTTTMVGTDATQTLTNKTLTSPTLTTPNIDSAQFATVSGTAPIYPCRAWVNFNGTGTPAIRASGNVSSITDNGTGDYTVNFTTALVDANYGVVGTNGAFTPTIIHDRCLFVTGDQCTTSGARVRIRSSNGTAYDDVYINVSIFR